MPSQNYTNRKKAIVLYQLLKVRLFIAHALNELNSTPEILMRMSSLKLCEKKKAHRISFSRFIQKEKILSHFEKMGKMWMSVWVCSGVCAFACIWMNAVTAFARVLCINIYASMLQNLWKRRCEWVFACYLWKLARIHLHTIIYSVLTTIRKLENTF